MIRPIVARGGGQARALDDQLNVKYQLLLLLIQLGKRSSPGALPIHSTLFVTASS